jgi:membrane fusion protein, multidrug efflux system
LREVTPLADAASRSYAMRIALNGNLDGVEMGMTANAVARRPSMTTPSGATSAPTQNDKLIALPLGAVFSKDNQPGVWVVDTAGAVSLVRIAIAGMNEEQVFVRSGLSTGQKVVTAGANLLKPGQVVRVEAPAK